MTHRRLVILTMAVGLLLALTTQATFAQPGPRPGGFGLGPRFGAASPAQALQLTDEQRSKLDALMSEVRAKIGPARDRVRTLHQQLRTELLADKPDEAKIKQLRSDLVKAEQELMGLRLDQQTRLAQILTPEQRKLIRERRASRALTGALGGLGFGPGARMGRRGPFALGLGPGLRGGAFVGPVRGWWLAPGARRLVGRGFWGFGWWWR